MSTDATKKQPTTEIPAIDFLNWTLPAPTGTVAVSGTLHETDCKCRWCEL